MGKTHEIVLNLKRTTPTENWGFSLVGGSDVKTPLIVTKVGFGSPVDGVLHRGDIISKVGNYDSRDIRHQDAQNLFKNAGNNIRVVVQREVAPRSTGSSRTSSHNYSPLSVSPHLSPKGYTSSSGYSPAGSALTPYYSSPLTPIDNNYFEANEYGTTRREDDDQKDIHVTQQVASSVLDRISTGDPNKQLVHKQFNSPINLYSEPNVVDTIQKQTGLKPQVRRQVKFNPSESETYKALQEEELGDNIQEVTVPPQSKVYAPNKTIPGKKPTLVVNQNPQYGNALGNDPDVIQQSGSFKRLMWSVLPGSQF
ncbi:PDZ and LIM domain protein 3 isoform X10 [Diorhabda carinulata]|uniref:PDZ and LIM domain protein 3 isoform X5 n=1 Tax=Diorhabda sublineata TaxID=1163346 RepID=UPI0024E07B3E|nr:PDZ and LIM domain protein 3 isoform X5 [Diorhabda sublineata]XP_057651135.1 PDZ and LIM domain protein 3 isoform X10 [Diorhabda carinulata]